MRFIGPFCKGEDDSCGRTRECSDCEQEYYAVQAGDFHPPMVVEAEVVERTPIKARIQDERR